MNRRSLLLLGGAAALTTTAAAALLVPVRDPATMIFKRDGVALGGTDPVAYFTHARPVQGEAKYAVEHAGATWHFANAMTRDAFAAAPADYMPQYGGFCAWALAEQDELIATKPENWAIVGGRLFLNFADDKHASWLKDPVPSIHKADAKWIDVETALRDGTPLPVSV